jgi:hypothetical protein
VSASTYGAVGNGVADDAAAVQRALDALKAGDELRVPAGTVYAHSKVLRVHTAGVRITGGGTFLATSQQYSAFFIDADNVTVDGTLTFRLASSTQRWDAYEQMKLRIGAHTGVTVTGATVDGSGAAGLYVGGASNFVLTDVTVQNTRADGIHMTEGSHDGQVVRPTIRNVGDDGVAVVSYIGSGLDHDITVTSPRFYGQTWGRAFSVVGGTNITYRDIYAANSSAASVYIAAEPSYQTYGNSNVLIDGGTIVNANVTSSVGHGAIMIYNGQSAETNSTITIRNLTIQNTSTAAPNDIRIVSDTTSCVQQHIAISNVTITGGPSYAFFANSGSASYDSSGITKNGVLLAAHNGW